MMAGDVWGVLRNTSKVLMKYLVGAGVPCTAH
jgi:hypothetical protein